MAIGQKLEEARNRKGISLREASESTKIRGDYLSAFEAGQFDIDLPEVYLRGFVRLYSRFLGLDQDAVLADLNLEMGNTTSRSTKKSLGSLSPPDNSEINDYSNVTPSVGKASADAPSYPNLLKPLLIVGVSVVVLSIVIFIAVNSGNGTDDPELPESSPNSSVVTETNPSSTSSDASQANKAHSLRFAVIAPIKHLIVRNEGGSFPETNQKTREYRDLPAGWEGTLTFKDSFKCYCSSLENLRFFVNDGAEKKIEGEGSGNFTWKPE
jgi:cytoskeletal protein RodZ